MKNSKFKYILNLLFATITLYIVVIVSTGYWNPRTWIYPSQVFFMMAILIFWVILNLDKESFK